MIAVVSVVGYHLTNLGPVKLASIADLSKWKVEVFAVEAHPVSDALCQGFLGQAVVAPVVWQSAAVVIISRRGTSTIVVLTNILFVVNSGTLCLHRKVRECHRCCCIIEWIEAILIHLKLKLLLLHLLQLAVVVRSWFITATLLV